MGKHRNESEIQTRAAGACFYRVTARGSRRHALALIDGWTPYLQDTLAMCGGGVREHELRQFMPPASLRASLDALLAAGLIERADRSRELLAA